MRGAWRLRGPAITRCWCCSRWERRRASGASLLENLFEFKRLYDTEATLSEALPDLVAKYPARYRNVTLRELSDEMHAAMIELKLAEPCGRGLRDRSRAGADAGGDLSEAAAKWDGEG